jgi:hypothetical protein
VSRKFALPRLAALAAFGLTAAIEPQVAQIPVFHDVLIFWAAFNFLQPLQERTSDLLFEN